MADISYTLDDVLVTAGETKTLAAWQGSGVVEPTTAATNLDGSISFDFNDATGRPEDVVVYTAGRPS